MSSPTTTSRCIDCSRLGVPRKTCKMCEEEWFKTKHVASPRVGEDLSSSKYTLNMSQTRSRTFEDLAEGILSKLNHQGYCVVDNFHKEAKSLAILQEVKAMHECGLMNNGQLTSSEASPNVRGDQIAWVDGTEGNTPNILSHMKRVDMLVGFLNNKITYYTISGRTKAMVSCYPGVPGEGKGYVKHFDNPCQDGRCITTLYYLNKDYNVLDDGGVLRLYPGNTEAYIDIEPVIDRFLIFWSDKRNPHEVLPSFSTRYAITLWYFDQEERKVEGERLKMLQSQTAEGNGGP